MGFLFGALFALAGAALVLTWFVHLERTGRSHVPAAIALGLLTFEAILLPSQGEVPKGLFSFPAGGQEVRLVAVVVILAVLARLWTRGFPTRISTTGMLWAAYLLWYGTGYVIGVVRGHPNSVIVFEFRSVVFIAAAYLLMAGTPLSAFLARRAVGYWVGALTVAVGIVAFTTLFELYVDVNLGLQSFPSLGAYGPSGRSVIASIAIVLISTEACRARPRTWVLVCSGLLLLSPVVGIQRASMVNASLIMTLLIAVAFGRTWRSRATVTPTVSGLVVLGFVGLLTLFVVLPPALTGEQSILVESLDRAFTGEGQIASAEARQRLWAETRDLISERPLLGWGLGKQSPLVLPRPNEVIYVSAHNIALDIWIRAGLVGLVLFSLAVWASLANAVRTWRRHPDPVIAAFALGCAIALIGLIGKGMVESVFENFRLALLFGFLIGGIAAANASREAEERRAALVEQLDRAPVRT